MIIFVRNKNLNKKSQVSTKVKKNRQMGRIKAKDDIKNESEKSVVGRGRVVGEGGGEGGGVVKN